jgi:hypothetical protein
MQEWDGESSLMYKKAANRCKRGMVSTVSCIERWLIYAREDGESRLMYRKVANQCMRGMVRAVSCIKRPLIDAREEW